MTSGKLPDTQDAEVVGSIAQQEQDPYLYTFGCLPQPFAKSRTDPLQNCRLVDTSQFYKDASSGTLPQVSWVIPSGNLSDHPSAGVREGMAYVTSLLPYPQPMQKIEKDKNYWC